VGFDLRAYQHELLDAAEERDWIVIRLDAREGLVLEEPVKMGLVLRITGLTLTPAFVRSLPLATLPPVRTLVDDSPCWCRFDNLEGHDAKCAERRERRGVSGSEP
jgi:hypothetical protein